MKWLLFFLLTSCVSSPVTSEHWAVCLEICFFRGGVMEACDEPFKGKGCHCNNDEIFWLEDWSLE